MRKLVRRTFEKSPYNLNLNARILFLPEWSQETKRQSWLGDSINADTNACASGQSGLSSELMADCLENSESALKRESGASGFRRPRLLHGRVGFHAPETLRARSDVFVPQTPAAA